MCDGQQDSASQGAVDSEFTDRSTRIQTLCQSFWLVEVEKDPTTANLAPNGLESLRLQAVDNSYDQTVQVAAAERWPAHLVFKFPIQSGQQPAICRLHYRSGGQTVQVWKGLRMPWQIEQGEPESNRRIPCLKRIFVRNGGTLATANTNVYLDVAGKYDSGQDSMEGFKYNHYVVRADHRLGISGGGEVCLPDPTLLTPPPDDQNQGGPVPRYNTYWCYWGTGQMDVRSNGRYRVVNGHYPLPARLDTDFNLELPVNKEISLRIYNLSSTSQSTIQGHINRANSFYNRMRIQLRCDIQNVPNTVRGTYRLERDPVEFVTHPSGPRASASSMNIQQWMSQGQPPGRNCIVVVYVEDVEPSGRGQVPGLASMLYRLVPSQRRQFPQFNFTPPADHGLIFMDGSIGNGFHLQHEVGHIVLDTYGKGSSYMSGTANVDVTAKQRLLTMGLDREADRPRDLRTRGERFYGLIQSGSHMQSADLLRANYTEQCMGPGRGDMETFDMHNPGQRPSYQLDLGNFMSPNGGDTIFPWQVALIRAAYEVEDWSIHA